MGGGLSLGVLVNVSYLSATDSGGLGHHHTTHAATAIIYRKNFWKTHPALVVVYIICCREQLG